MKRWNGTVLTVFFAVTGISLLITIGFLYAHYPDAFAFLGSANLGWRTVFLLN